MWKSTNGGGKWRKTTTPDQLQSVTCIVQDLRSGEENTWYYGTGERRGNSARGGGADYLGDGIFKSIDNGETWSILESTTTSTPQRFTSDFNYVWNMAVDNSNLVDDEVYAATYDGIYRSINGGVTWDQVMGGGENESQYTDVKITSDGVLYAAFSDGTNSGVWRSEDGINWVDITPSDWFLSSSRTVLDIAPSNENVVYFLTERDTDTAEFRKYTYSSGEGSGDGGTWVTRTNFLPDYDESIGDYDTQNSYNMVLEVYPTDENIVFIGGLNLYRSDDGFASTDGTKWIGGYSVAATDQDAKTYSEHHPDQHALVFQPSNPKIAYSGHDGGISKIKITSSALAGFPLWDDKNNGYVTTQFYSVAITPEDDTDKFIIGGMQDNSMWWITEDDPSEDWETFPIGGDGAYAAVSDTGKYFYMSTQGSPIIKLGEEGWAQINPDLVSPLFTNPYILDPNDWNVMYVADVGNVWRNSDLSEIDLDYTQEPKEKNWKKMLTGVAVDGNVSTLAVSKEPAHVLYFGTQTGEIYRIPNSIEDPATAEKISSGKGLPSAGYVSCLMVDKTDADKVIAVFSNYEVQSVFYTINAGVTWTDISGNLEENLDGTGNGPSVRWAAMLIENNVKTYFLGTSTGLYSTDNIDGINTLWANESPDLIGNVVINMIATRDGDGEVVVATHGNGVYSRDFVTSVEDDPEIIPENYKLMQNYPNPFNPETNISFELPASGKVTVEVFNVLGQKVRTLISDGLYQSGRNLIKFNGKDDLGRSLATGVYIYTFKSGIYKESRKMILLK